MRPPLLLFVFIVFSLDRIIALFFNLPLSFWSLLVLLWLLRSKNLNRDSVWLIVASLPVDILTTQPYFQATLTAIFSCMTVYFVRKQFAVAEKNPWLFGLFFVVLSGLFLAPMFLTGRLIFSADLIKIHFIQVVASLVFYLLFEAYLVHSSNSYAWQEISDKKFGK